MGTTLTGTTPQDTYDSLIKVTDNGPLSGTAKYLSDGLGNDSALALSTGDIGIGTTSLLSASGFRTLTMNGSSASLIELQGGGTSYARIQANSSEFAILARGNAPMVFYTNPSASDTERMRITASGNVGIGTTPSAWGSTFRALQIGAGTAVYNNDAANGSFFVSNSFYNGSNNIYKNDGTATAYGQISGKHSFFTAPSGTAGGTVAFVERVAITSDGLTFNGDTAAANALDDYEEGTWTMGVSFGGASVGVTYGVRTGTYTKVGRKVTVNGLMSLSNKGTSTGAATITGLPFAIASGNPQYATAAICLFNVSYTGQFYAFGNVGGTSITLEEVSSLGAPTTITDTQFVNNSSLVVSLTYFV
jgi:hypothetical protein